MEFPSSMQSAINSARLISKEHELFKMLIDKTPRIPGNAYNDTFVEFIKGVMRLHRSLETFINANSTVLQDFQSNRSPSAEVIGELKADLAKVKNALDETSVDKIKKLINDATGAEKLISKMQQSENQRQTRIGLQDIKIQTINLESEINEKKKRKEDIQFEISSVGKDITLREQELVKLLELVDDIQKTKSILSEKNNAHKESPPPEVSTWKKNPPPQETSWNLNPFSWGKPKSNPNKKEKKDKNQAVVEKDTPTHEVKHNLGVHYLYLVDELLTNKDDIQECIKEFEERVKLKQHPVNLHWIDTTKLKKLPGVNTDGPLPTLVIILILKKEITNFDGLVSNLKKEYTSPIYWLIVGWEGLLSLGVLKKYATTANGNFLIQIGTNCIDACETTYDISALKDYLSQISVISETVATPTPSSSDNNSNSAIAREVEKSKKEFERAVQASIQSKNQVLERDDRETQIASKRLMDAQKEKEDNNLEGYQQRINKLQSETKKLKVSQEELQREILVIEKTLLEKGEQKKEKEMMMKEALREIPTPKQCESDKDLYSVVYIYGPILKDVHGLILKYQKLTPAIEEVVVCVQSLLEEDDFTTHQENYYNLLKELCLFKK